MGVGGGVAECTKLPGLHQVEHAAAAAAFGGSSCVVAYGATGSGKTHLATRLMVRV